MRQNKSAKCVYARVLSYGEHAQSSIVIVLLTDD